MATKQQKRRVKLVDIAAWKAEAAQKAFQRWNVQGVPHTGTPGVFDAACGCAQCQVSNGPVNPETVALHKCGCEHCRMASELTTGNGHISHVSGGPDEFCMYGPYVEKDLDGNVKHVYNVGDIIPGAPAPVTTVWTFERNRRDDWTGKVLGVPADWVDLETVRKRCAAAARLQMAGDSFTPEDREDCAASLLADALEGLPDLATVGKHLVTADDVLRATRAAVESPETDKARKVQEAKDLANAYRSQVRKTKKARAEFLHGRSVNIVDMVPPDRCTYTRLAGLAANYRRSLERDRVRDENATGPGFGDNVVNMTDNFEHELVNRHTRKGAVVKALAMAHALGITCGPARRGDRNLAVLLYAASRVVWIGAVRDDGSVRSPDEMARLESKQSAVIAAELGMSKASYEKACQRAVKHLDSLQVFDLAAHWHTLHLPDGGIAARKRAASLETGDWRDWQPQPHNPVKVSRCRKRSASAGPASWIGTMRPESVKRLATASGLAKARCERARLAGYAAAVNPLDNRYYWHDARGRLVEDRYQVHHVIDGKDVDTGKRNIRTGKASRKTVKAVDNAAGAQRRARGKVKGGK